MIDTFRARTNRRVGAGWFFKYVISVLDIGLKI